VPQAFPAAHQRLAGHAPRTSARLPPTSLALLVAVRAREKHPDGNCNSHHASVVESPCWHLDRLQRAVLL